MDEVIVPVKMRVSDLIVIWNLAQREKRTVEDWIMMCVAEKVERMQEEWRSQQKAAEAKPEGGRKA